MSFELPKYQHPDFTREKFLNSPDVKWEEAPMDGVAPEYYHSTSMFPEYFKINGEWKGYRMLRWSNPHPASV